MQSALPPPSTQPLLLHGFLQVFAVGFVGGLIGDLVLIWELRTTGAAPVYVKNRFYWACVLGMALAGGILSTFYGIVEVQAFLALNIGISAPLILKTLASGTKTIKID